uniref:BMP family ABC transporter substrate-binding protein n=1 Tax=Acetatifactor sp. TaxID=1872090 RepID=UPI0040571FCA
MMKNSKLKQVLPLVLAAIILLIILVLIMMTGYDKKNMPKVGVIITGAIDDEGWNGVHYQGVLNACEKLGAKLLVKENVPEGTDRCVEAIRELAMEGAEMIILSSYAYPSEVKDTIQSYPEIAFYGISAEYYADNMTSYFGRMYQARYLAGIVAGMKTESNVVGYVAAMPNIEVNRGINAFTLGVRSVNPDAMVKVVWTGIWEHEEQETLAANRLIEELDADVITYHQNQHYVAQVADAAGVYSIGYNEMAEGLSEKYLTATVWDWNSLYYEIVRELMQGKANSVKRHWFGIDTGVVGLAEYSSLVEEEIRDTVDCARKEMSVGKNIFSGVIYDNKGELRCGEGESISDEILLEKMDWYVDGVVIYE